MVVVGVVVVVVVVVVEVVMVSGAHMCVTYHSFQQIKVKMNMDAECLKYIVLLVPLLGVSKRRDSPYI